MAEDVKDSRTKNQARFTTDDFEAEVNYKIGFSDTGLKGAKTKSLESNEISKWMNIAYDKVTLDGGIF